MRSLILGCTAGFLLPATIVAQQPPLLSAPTTDALAKELSGDRALETIRGISANHRVRGSRPFHAAAELIASKARAAGLDSVVINEFPADGKIFYGTQRSRPPWDAEFAELREGNRVIASWEKQPMSLAEDSESGDVTTDIVDVGNGTDESAYSGKNVKGKLILASSQADAVAAIGVEKHGAVGIVSYAQNQHTGWWGENKDLVRWGHLDTFAKTKTFAFMVSPATAQTLKNRLARGEKVRLHAVVKAGQHPGAYSVVTAMIPGARFRDQEIVFSCHLDHPNPGANDNASGCATILEVGVTLSKLIRDGKIPRPDRTIRFVWPPEVEGTMAILNSKPEWAKRIKAVIHMDMVGAGLESKSVFHVSAGPGHLPSYVYDIGQAFGAWVNDQTYQYAATGTSQYPLVSPKGGKEPLLAALDEYDMGSDHDVYQDASWGIPAIYLHDWPDRYIHTTWDTPDRIDPTKLLRAAFIGAASGYFLATMAGTDYGKMLLAVDQGGVRRELRRKERQVGVSDIDTLNARRYYADYQQIVRNQAAIASCDRCGEYPRFKPFKWSRQIPDKVEGDSALVFVRVNSIRGPMSVFGFDYLQDKLGADRVSNLKLLKYEAARGTSGDYAYEVLNFTGEDMRVIDIVNAVSAIYGAIPFDAVLEYLRALEEAGVVHRQGSAH
jgi:hypothetical protein